RHTRSKRDWSSDVCSSDLSGWTSRKMIPVAGIRCGSIHPDQHVMVANPLFNGTTIRTVYLGNDGGLFRAGDIYTASSGSGWANRSEERRVGKEGGWRRARD